jgi:cytochrome c-type biogenesis protein CcmH/NrfG
MKRVIAVIVIAALTTLMIGIDRTSWAGQDRDQKKVEKQKAAVARNLAGMQRGSPATLERTDGTKIDVVIEEITADTITVLRQDQDRSLGTETIAIADIAKIEKMSPKKAGKSSKALIGTAIALGVIVGLVAVCASSYSSDQQQITKS